ncbi:F-box/kelch-repeat protein At3g06240-like [Bidens hawaiensis]|uniref:F-box/kelch-repeat protein At3g06240-like n=1 Tax=Bidens hawaiensis TaxID=980011 RepID=UPI004049E50A
MSFRSSSSSSSSSSMEDVLPSSLMLDVFSRLAVKSVIYCKCVCKRWRDLVSDPYFVHLHLSRSREALIINEFENQEFYKRRQPGSLTWLENEHEHELKITHRVKSLNLNRGARLEGFRIVQLGSVNGLVSCWCSHDYICIFNPVLEEYITLPIPRLNWEPWFYFYGFGASKAGEYKMVRICGRKVYEDYVVEVDVYTLGTLHWRLVAQITLIEQVVPDIPFCTPCAGVFSNGHVYFLLGKEIYDFDLNTETFELFPSPPAVEGHEQESNHMLGVLKGRLSRVSWCFSQLEVWVMKEGSWYKEIAIQDVVVRDNLEFLVWRPLCLMDDLNGASFFYVKRSSKGKTSGILSSHKYC